MWDGQEWGGEGKEMLTLCALGAVPHAAGLAEQDGPTPVAHSSPRILSVWSYVPLIGEGAEPGGSHGA